jgi:hypothetical protein
MALHPETSALAEFGKGFIKYGLYSLILLVWDYFWVILNPLIFGTFSNNEVNSIVLFIEFAFGLFVSYFLIYI